MMMMMMRSKDIPAAAACMIAPPCANTDTEKKSTQTHKFALAYTPLLYADTCKHISYVQMRSGEAERKSSVAALGR
jgi:hypothetical protein